MVIKKWIRSNDNEAPKSVGIDVVSNRIYMITQKGSFFVYDLTNFDVIY